MTIQEASELYRIPLHILQEYERWGLCRAVKDVMGTWQYDQTDIERLSLILTLHDVGFSPEEVEHYMRPLLAGDSTREERARMLKERRDGTLDEIHLHQQQLDRLDYLRYELAQGRLGR